MYKTRFIIKVKTHNPETGREFETSLYKDADLPFLPTLGLKIDFDDLVVAPLLKNIVWNINGKYFICYCEDDIPSEKIGKYEKYKWHASYVDQEFKINGWLVFEVEDEV